jgi:aerobic-type carbon monoxide dehydrogenase small subunit (CoxS/CutS family)
MRIEAHPILEPLPAVSSVTFSFDGRNVEGRPGEPIAVALLAAGVRIFRTMPRFGDARGGYCMVGRCADCTVIVDGVPGIRACVTPVRAGIEVRTQHGLGQLDDSFVPDPSR